MVPLIPYPAIDPVLVSLGPFPIRWYALAYIAGFVAGWAYARLLCGREALWGGVPHPTPASIDDLVVFVALGIVAGGRLGYVLFYNPGYYLAHPLKVPVLWEGGMAFHGGLVGATVGLWLFARRCGANPLTVADVVAGGVPAGLFFGRLANFIKPELWGRPTDVPWAMRFPLPLPNGAPCRPAMICDLTPPSHPSQLYEAGLEGVVLFLLLALLIRAGALRRPGLTAGVFAVGYGVARIACEVFREPDPQLGFLFGGATMGMLLSLPVILAGLGLVAWSIRRAPAAAPA